MSELDLQKAYDRFKLAPDADQEEIRRVYLQLRQELDGEDLRLLYSAWENLWSPQNRVRVDAMLLQADRHAPSVDELLTEIGPTADSTEWNTFIDRDGIVQREAAALTSLILERTWLGHAYDTLFTRQPPQTVAQPAPQPTLTPVTKAVPARTTDVTVSAAPVSAPVAIPASAQAAEPATPKARAGGGLWGYRPALAIALLAVLALVFVAARGGFATDDQDLATTAEDSQPSTIARVDSYNAPSMAFIVPTSTPIGQRPILVVQFVPQTPSALTAPIDSAAIIAELRERVEKNTEVVEPTESAFGRSISFGSVSPAPRMSVPSAPVMSNPEVSSAETATTTINGVPVVLPATATATVTAAATATATATATPAATATPIPVLAVSRNYSNIRSGPGTEFGVVEIVEPQTSRPILGRTRSAAWLLVETSAGGSGWISLSVVDVDGDVGSISIVE